MLLVVECLLSSYGRAARVIEHEQVEYSPKGYWAPQLLTKGHSAERRTAFSSHETQRLAPDREYARCWWTCQRHLGDAGTMVLIHQRALPAKGDHSQNWRATDPSTSGNQPHNWSSRRYFLNLEFGGHVLEVSSTSRTMASRRSVPRVALRPVGGCGTGDVITVRFPFVCCPQYGFLWYFNFSLRLGGVFSRFVLLVVQVPARKMEKEHRPCGGGVSGPLGAQSLCCSWCCQS